MVAQRESSHLPMGDKKANEVQRSDDTLLAHTQSKPLSPLCVLGLELFICLLEISPSSSLYPYNYQCRNEAKYSRNFPRLINSAKLALSCIWKTSVEFLSPNVKCLCFNQWETRGRQVCCKYLCTCQHKHQRSDVFQKVHNGIHSKNQCDRPSSYIY